MLIHRLVALVICVASPLPPLLAGELRYGVTADESQWSSSGNRLACRLSQKIPYFGQALFTSRAGGGLTLSFQLEREPVKKRRVAHLRATPPPWKHDIPDVDIAKVTLNTGKTLVVFGRSAALRALYELEKGMSPQLTFQDWADGRDRISARISPVNLRSALSLFQQCSGALHPDSFDDIRNMDIRFSNDSYQLTRKSKTILKRIIAYLKVDPAISRIILTGYANRDSNELYNQELSQMRLDTVQEYLTNSAVPAELIVSINLNDRAKNSRKTKRGVHIRLEKE